MFAFNSTRRWVSMFAAAALFGMLPSVSKAAGVQVYKQEIVGAKPGQAQLFFNDPLFFDREVQKAWNTARPLIEQRIGSELRKAHYGDYHLYDIHVKLAQSGVVRLAPYGTSAMKISYVLKNNHVDAKVDIPWVPGFLEPKFNVNFDATVSIIVTLPRIGAPTKVTWVGAQLDRVTVSPGNLSGSIAKFFVDHFTTGGSRELLRRAMTYANTHLQTRIDLPLRNVDTLIANAAKLGYNAITSRVQGNNLLVTLIKRPNVIPQGANAQMLQR